MPLTPARVLRTPMHAVSHDGVDDLSVIEPFTVYGWSEITIEEWIYAVHPKNNYLYANFSMIGDRWADYPATFIWTNNKFDYNILRPNLYVRRPDGSPYEYYYELFPLVNRWVQLIRRFTSTREFSIWVNGEKRYYVTVPSDYITVLEWNPDGATYPERYRRFVLGASTIFGSFMTIMCGLLRIYRSALSTDEILWNHDNPDDPVSNSLEVSLYAHPDNIYDIDNDGILEWIDLSGKGHHAKLYGSKLTTLVKEPARVLSPARVLAPAR